MPTMPESYYNRFDPTKNYDAHLFRAGYVLQSAELNELQSHQADHVKRIGDALLKDGAIIRDAQLIVNPDTGEALGASGALYLKGAVRGIPERSFTIPITGIVTVGVYLIETVVTALEDPALRDPAIGVRNYQEPGAARLKAEPRWGYIGESNPPSAEFYPVHTVQDGIVAAKEAPPQIEAVSMALARYDRESSGGYYVTSGMRVAAEADNGSGHQVYSIQEGVARVDGQAVYFPTAIREVYPAAPDLATIDSEPHVSSGVAPQRVDLNHAPVSSIPQVRVTAVKTVALTHGAYSGALDALPDTAVLELVTVSQGATTYVQGTDYKLTGDTVDWSLAGAEPAPGSSYSVTYHYMLTVTPTAIDSTGCTVAGAVTGTLILVTYLWKVPRWDRLCLNTQGQRVWLQGVPHAYRPVPPAVSPGLLALASIRQTWTADRRVSLDSARMVPMGDLDAMAKSIEDLYALMAEQRLLTDAAINEPTSKLGVFVDPFLDDDLRDQGLAQTAAIVNGQLTMGFDFGDSTAVAMPGISMLPRALSLAVVVEQPTRTGFMQVNPYQAFSPLPAIVILSPAEDLWVETVTDWTSVITALFDEPSSVQSVQYLRQITVQFSVSGFDPGEILTQLLFDGINVTPPTLTANGSGEITGSFQIPALIRVGTKRVQFLGNLGSYGEATFTGQGTIRTLPGSGGGGGVSPGPGSGGIVEPGPGGWGPGGWNGGSGGGYNGGNSWSGPAWTTTYVDPVTGAATCGGNYYPPGWNMPYEPWATCTGFDPLAQTFVLPQSGMIGGIKLWFTAKGTSRVKVQIRETQNGVPTPLILVETDIDPADIVLVGPTQLTWPPILLNAGHEYAIVVACDDADAAVAIAELGKYDSGNQRWVTSQPYQVGVLLSSSNNSTWTAHQDRDLTFQLLGATFSATSQAVTLPNIAVVDCTEVMVRASVHRPSAGTDVQFELTLPDVANTKIIVTENQPVVLPASVTGNIQWRALLTGTTTFSPWLFPDLQLAWGNRLTGGSYISRAIVAGVTCTATAYLDTYIPGASNIAVEMQDGASWLAMPLISGTPVGDGWETRKYQLSSVSPDDQETRIRLTLNGTSQTRPIASKLRAVIT